MDGSASAVETFATSAATFAGLRLPATLEMAPTMSMEMVMLTPLARRRRAPTVLATSLERTVVVTPVAASVMVAMLTELSETPEALAMLLRSGPETPGESTVAAVTVEPESARPNETEAESTTVDEPPPQLP